MADSIAHLLYVEDDESLSFVTRDNLEQKGYTVTYCEDGERALEAIKSNQKFDLCILDVMLPRVDGFTLAEEIRKRDVQVPIIFLTAKSMKQDKIHGLTIGGDDYITKPFSIEELILKVDIFLRRTKFSNVQKSNLPLTIGNYAFDYKNLHLGCGDYAETLTQKEADLLKLLNENRNDVLKRSFILETIWGKDDYFLGRSLDVFISRLRKYLSLDERIKIDMHTHLLPEHLPDFAAKFGYGEFIRLEHHRPGFARMMKGSTFFREIAKNCWDPETRISEYALYKTPLQVVCTIPVMFSYWAQPEDTLYLSKFLNDHLAGVVDDFPEHYLALGTLPMQDTDLAIRELERLKSMDFPGIQIGSNVNQLNLSEPQFFPIFEACQDLDMAILVHPWEMMGEADMRKYWLPWLVGMPAETARAAASLIFGGVMERLPRLRWCFAHAGGSFIPTIGRLEHGFNCRPDLVAVDNPVNPRNYLGRFWVDSATHDPQLLRYILDVIGDEKICLGTDYPFPLGDLEIGAFIEKMGLQEAVKDKIYFENTLKWLYG